MFIIKNILLFTGIVFYCCSCSTYYYSSVSCSDPDIMRNNRSDFVTENDSVRIAYRFFGANAPIHISIFNKTDKPLFVDWDQSALIIDNNSTSYHTPTSQTTGQLQSQTYIYGRYFQDTYESYTQTTTHSKSVSFIPPKSQIERVPLQLSNFNFEGIPNNEYETKKFGTVNVKERNYSEAESPLKFRSYVTIFTDQPGRENSQSVAFEQDFYLSRIMKTKEVEPMDILDYNKQRGDFFYIKKTKGQGVGAFFGVIAVGIAVGTVEVATEAAINSLINN